MLKAINWFYLIYWSDFCNNYYWLKVGFSVLQADFFVTYILTSGLSGFSLEILQPVLLSWDLLKSCICCSGKEKEAYLYSLPHSRIIPFISLFLLIGMVYAVVAPLLLPFLIGYFCLGYVVYVNQVNLSLVFYPRWAFLSFCVRVYHLYLVMHFSSTWQLHGSFTCVKGKSGSTGTPMVSTGRLVPSIGDALLALIGRAKPLALLLWRVIN